MVEDGCPTAVCLLQSVIHECVPSNVQQSVSLARVAQLTVAFASDSTPETASWWPLLHPHVSINSTTQYPVFPGRSEALRHNLISTSASRILCRPFFVEDN